MRRAKLADLDTVITGGVDREGGGDGPVVVLLHGFGAPGEDLAPLWRVLEVPRETRFVFPAAPIALPPMFGAGRAWWLIDLERIAATLAGEPFEAPRGEPDGLPEARAQVGAMLDEVERAISPSKIILGGFSQGAMLSCDVALGSARRLDGLVQLSGTLLLEEKWTREAPARRGLPVLQSHGMEDPLLPFAAAERLRALLDAAGLPVEWVEFHGGHAIPDRVLERLSAFVTTIAGA